jgi:hypothetical protein
MRRRPGVIASAPYLRVTAQPEGGNAMIYLIMKFIRKLKRRKAR